MRVNLVIFGFLLALISPFSTSTAGASELFRNADWYKKADAKEQILEGIVKLAPGNGKIGLPERYCTFRLVVMEKRGPVSKPIYTGGHDELLAPYVGHLVEIVGKVVAVEVDGEKREEVWPAEITGTSISKLLGKLEIQARTNGWKPRAGTDTKPKAFVIRSSQELARLAGLKQADIATKNLARLLGVPTIDWEWQMILCVTGGRQSSRKEVDIYRIVISESNADVYWRLVPSASRSGRYDPYPALTVLVPRIDATIRFLQNGRPPAIIVQPPSRKTPERKPND